jgi:hypothetical protein
MAARLSSIDANGGEMPTWVVCTVAVTQRVRRLATTRSLHEDQQGAEAPDAQADIEIGAATRPVHRATLRLLLSFTPQPGLWLQTVDALARLTIFRGADVVLFLYRPPGCSGDRCCRCPRAARRAGLLFPGPVRASTVSVPGEPSCTPPPWSRGAGHADTYWVRDRTQRPLSRLFALSRHSDFPGLTAAGSAAGRRRAAIPKFTLQPPPPNA